MQQCQRRSASLPFQREDEIHDDMKLPSCTERMRIPSGTQQIPRIWLPNQPERRSSQLYASGRGSLLSSRRQSKSNSSCTRNSSRKPSLGVRDIDMFPSIYRETVEKNGRLLGSMAVKDVDANESVNDIKELDLNRVETLPQGRNLRKAELVSAIHPHQEYLLHALTTLAINSLTSELTPREESERRLAALSYMSHRKADKLMSPSEEGNQGKVSQEPISRSSSSGSFSHDTSRLDELFASVEDTTDATVKDAHVGNTSETTTMGKQPTNSEKFLKRSRINQLRNYLRYSGFGEPAVIVSSGSKADQIRLGRLLQRMRKNDSPQRQERLRLRARLDYEMSLMRAVSFCEQQEQVFFRSASVDMENTDLQMLEDDLKYQAIQEMRRNARNMNHQNNGRKAEAGMNNATTRRNGVTQDNIIPQHARGGEKEQTRAEILHSPANHQPVSRCNTQSGTSLGYEGDIMSGLMGSPLSKQELKDRIHSWLTGVTTAMASSTKEERRYGLQL